MSQPTQSAVHAVDVPLTNVSVAYLQSDTHFVARQVFPMVPVEKQTDRYYIYDLEDFNRDEAKVRADATESAGSGYGLSTAQYSCDVFALHKDIGSQVRANADAAINPDRDATLWLTQRMLIRLEKQWATDYFTTSVWGTDSTPTNLWSDYTASDPVEDVETGKATILTATGQMPNTLVLGYHTYRRLRNHPDVIERIKYTQFAGTRTITPSLLAAVFDVERVLVSMATNDTAVENETASMALLFGKHALLCHSASSPGLLTPSAGYVFSWRGVSQGMGSDVAIKRFYMQEKDADRVEAQMAFDCKVVSSSLGYFFASVVS